MVGNLVRSVGKILLFKGALSKNRSQSENEENKTKKNKDKKDPTDRLPGLTLAHCICCSCRLELSVCSENVDLENVL